MAIYERELGQARRDLHILVNHILEFHERKTAGRYPVGNGGWVCNKCGNKVLYEFSYCPHCGRIFGKHNCQRGVYVTKRIKQEIDAFLAKGMKDAELEEALKELLNVEKRIAKIKEELLSYEEEGEANDV